MKSEIFLVEEGDEGVKIIKFLQKKIRSLNFNQLSQLLRKGCIKWQDTRITKDIILAVGDKVELFAKINYEVAKEKIPLQSEVVQSTIKSILHKDDNFIALNKKAGLAVQGGTKVKFSLDDIIIHLSFERSNKPKLVHRLDRETSGLILLARHDRSAVELTALFRERQIKKYYLAICSGQPPAMEGTIKVALPNIEKPGKPDSIAITHYKILSSQDRYSLVRFEIETGKKHQIRIHAASLGLPIFGDVKYGGKPASRLFLHSYQMLFSLEGKSLNIKAPLPPVFEETLSHLGLSGAIF